MKLLVVSDTHGRIEHVLHLLPVLHGLDGIVHLGDNARDGEQIRKVSGLPVYQVPGNCDGATQKKSAMQVLETPFGRILLTHGHLHNAKAGPERLVYQAHELDCVAVLFGHTHIPYFGEWDGVRLVNPGSISFPRHGTTESYAMLTLETGRFDCAIVHYNQDLIDDLKKFKDEASPVPAGEDSSGTDKKPPGKKPPGGFLRNLINHSDRF